MGTGCCAVPVRGGYIGMGQQQLQRRQVAGWVPTAASLPGVNR